MADECDVKKNGAWMPSRIHRQTTCNCKSAESRFVVVCMGQPSFVYVLWVHCDFDLMIFLEREMKEQEDGVVIGAGCPLAEQLLPHTHFYWKSPRCPKSKFLAVERGKVRPRCPKSSLSKADAVQSRRCPKSTLSKVWRCQKKKKSQNFAGIWLDRACESVASDSSGQVPWPGRIKTSTRHVPGPVTGIWLVSFRMFS